MHTVPKEWSAPICNSLTAPIHYSLPFLCNISFCQQRALKGHYRDRANERACALFPWCCCPRRVWGRPAGTGKRPYPASHLQWVSSSGTRWTLWQVSSSLVGCEFPVGQHYLLHWGLILLLFQLSVPSIFTCPWPLRLLCAFAIDPLLFLWQLAFSVKRSF